MCTVQCKMCTLQLSYPLFKHAHTPIIPFTFYRKGVIRGPVGLTCPVLDLRITMYETGWWKRTVSCCRKSGKFGNYMFRSFSTH